MASDEASTRRNTKAKDESYSHYIGLKPVEGNYNVYDELQHHETKTVKHVKPWLKIVLISIFVAFLSSGITYMVVYLLQNKNIQDTSEKNQINTSCFSGPLKSINHFPKKRVTCPQTWESYSTFCLKEYTEEKIWHRAHFTCLSVGADLLSIHNQNENKFLRSRFVSDNYWIGLNDVEKEGQFIWSDGSDLNYTNWRPGEPINLKNNEDCVELNQGSEWNDINCFSALKFICKMERPLQCGNGTWYFYNKSCYLFNEKDALPWNYARARCVKEGADLLVIQDKDEYNYVHSSLKPAQRNNVWIGLYIKEKGELKTVDGSKPNYIPWKIEGSDISNLTLKCIAMNTEKRTGGWVRHDCNTLYGYVCEKRP